MDNMSVLSEQISKLRSCSTTLTGITEALAKMLSAQEGQGALCDTGTQAHEKIATIRLDVDEPMTLEEMRHRLMVIAKDWKAEDMKALLSKYSASKLSEVDPNQYESMLADAQSMNKDR